MRRATRERERRKRAQKDVDESLMSEGGTDDKDRPSENKLRERKEVIKEGTVVAVIEEPILDFIHRHRIRPRGMGSGGGESTVYPT